MLNYPRWLELLYQNRQNWNHPTLMVLMLLLYWIHRMLELTLLAFRSLRIKIYDLIDIQIKLEKHEMFTNQPLRMKFVRNPVLLRSLELVLLRIRQLVMLRNLKFVLHRNPQLVLLLVHQMLVVPLWPVCWMRNSQKRLMDCQFDHKHKLNITKNIDNLEGNWFQWTYAWLVCSFQLHSYYQN